MTYRSPRVTGDYAGCHVERAPGKVSVYIEVERDGEVRPEILEFTPSAFEDFRYVIADRSEGLGQRRKTQWQRRVAQTNTPRNLE